MRKFWEPNTEEGQRKLLMAKIVFTFVLTAYDFASDVAVVSLWWDDSYALHPVACGVSNPSPIADRNLEPLFMRECMYDWLINEGFEESDLPSMTSVLTISPFVLPSSSVSNSFFEGVTNNIGDTSGYNYTELSLESDGFTPHIPTNDLLSAEIYFERNRVCDTSGTDVCRGREMIWKRDLYRGSVPLLHDSLPGPIGCYFVPSENAYCMDFLPYTISPIRHQRNFLVDEETYSNYQPTLVLYRSGGSNFRGFLKIYDNQNSFHTAETLGDIFDFQMKIRWDNAANYNTRGHLDLNNQGSDYIKHCSCPRFSALTIAGTTFLIVSSVINIAMYVYNYRKDIHFIPRTSTLGWVGHVLFDWTFAVAGVHQGPRMKLVSKPEWFVSTVLRMLLEDIPQLVIQVLFLTSVAVELGTSSVGTLVVVSVLFSCIMMVYKVAMLVYNYNSVARMWEDSRRGPNRVVVDGAPQDTLQRIRELQAWCAENEGILEQDNASLRVLKSETEAKLQTKAGPPPAPPRAKAIPGTSAEEQVEALERDRETLSAQIEKLRVQEQAVREVLAKKKVVVEAEGTERE